MGNEGPGLRGRFLFSHKHHITEHDGRHTCFFFEQHAEGAQAFEAYFVTNLGNGMFLLQQFLRFLKPLAREVLVRGFAVHAAEEAVEMESGKEGPFRDPIQADRLMEIIIHVHFGGHYPLTGIFCQFHHMNLPNRFDQVPEHHKTDDDLQE